MVSQVDRLDADSVHFNAVPCGDNSAGFDHGIDIGRYGSVIFDDIVGQPISLPAAFFLIMVNRPMETFAARTVVPVLGWSCSEDRMFNREQEES